MIFHDYYENVHMIEAPGPDGRGGIHLGNWNSPRDSAYLRKHGVTHVVSALPGHLCEIRELGELQIVQHVVSCNDVPSFDMTPFLDEAADFIAEGVAAGSVLVHCAAGISRSSTCLIAYFIKHRGMTMEAALDLLRSKRNCVSPNLGFQKQLKAFEKKVAAAREQGAPLAGARFKTPCS